MLDAAGAGGLELLLGSGLQGRVADFDGCGWVFGFKGKGKSGVNQQNRAAGIRGSGQKEAGRPALRLMIGLSPFGLQALGLYQINLGPVTVLLQKIE